MPPHPFLEEALDIFLALLKSVENLNVLHC